MPHWLWGLPTLRSPVAPIAARILSSNAGEHGPHANAECGNWISGARCLNRRYRYGARGLHYHILLRQYSQNCCTYNIVVKNTYSHCHKDACVQISMGNTE